MATFNFHHPNAPDDRICAVCQAPFDDAHELVPCRHICCKACVETLGSRSCPICRAEVQHLTPPHPALVCLTVGVHPCPSDPPLLLSSDSASFEELVPALPDSPAQSTGIGVDELIDENRDAWDEAVGHEVPTSERQALPQSDPHMPRGGFADTTGTASQEDPRPGLPRHQEIDPALPDSPAQSTGIGVDELIDENRDASISAGADACVFVPATQYVELPQFDHDMPMWRGGVARAARNAARRWQSGPGKSAQLILIDVDTASSDGASAAN